MWIWSAGMSETQVGPKVSSEQGHGAGVKGRSGAVLSELLVEIAREPVQVEVSDVRVLFELLGFLLREAVGSSAFSCQ